jgi:hypothetical protein
MTLWRALRERHEHQTVHGQIDLTIQTIRLAPILPGQFGRTGVGRQSENVFAVARHQH